MIIFPLYAALVWYFCFRWRRHWLGFLSVTAGLAMVGLTSYALDAIQHWVTRAGDARMDTRLFHMLLGVESAMVGIVGVFFACLPRESPEKPCRRCRYELAGLDEPNPTCPECGLAFAAAKVRLRECSVCRKKAWMERGRDRCDACRHAQGHDPDIPGQQPPRLTAGSAAPALRPAGPAPATR